MWANPTELGRAMIEKHLAGQAVKKSDFSTERKLYISRAGASFCFRRAYENKMAGEE